MDPEAIKRYIFSIGSFRAPKIDSVFLNILEQFAWESSLSAYQIWTKLKSTDTEMAYKNVNKRLHGLVSLNLIQEIGANKNNTDKHKAKYYSLTEFGIYQLFINKLSELRLRKLDTIKFNKPPSSNTLIFFNNYHNCFLFESFLYPYFKKDTLFAIGNFLLWDLYGYLANCCQRIKERLEDNNYGIPVYDTIFYWNKVPGKDNKKLLLHLKEKFNLENIDSCKIENSSNNNDTITIETSTAPILLMYDRERKKILAMTRAGGQIKELEYSTAKRGGDILVGMQLPDEEFLGEIISNAKRHTQQIIYDFVYDLSSGVSDPEKRQEFLYYHKILSQDKKFMAAIKDIYKSRHEGFEKGYRMLHNQA